MCQVVSGSAKCRLTPLLFIFAQNPLSIEKYADISILLTTFSWLDLIDLLLVAFLLYQVYKLIKGTPALTIFLGLAALYLIYLLTDYIGLRVLSRLFGQFAGVGAVALIVVFQQEIRRFLLMVGKVGVTGHRKLLMGILKGKNSKSSAELDYGEICLALEKFSRDKTGALIVVTDQPQLKPYEDSGVALHARLTAELLENIFFKNSPLHDGAVVISGNKVNAARVILPISEQSESLGNLGLRHRAGLGISEHAEVLVFMVSEETGSISMAFRGKLYHEVTVDMARKKMKEFKMHKLRP